MMSEPSEFRYSSRYSEHFQEQLLLLSDSVYERVDRSIALLERMPELGRRYNPEFDADIPPVRCLMKYVPDTTKCLYYVVDQRAGVLRFFHIGDTRQDPTQLVTGVHVD